jgi:hypothetical protein
VAGKKRSTLRAQASQLHALANAYTNLASQHRITASALERGQLKQITAMGDLSQWIFKACELSAQAERVLASEVEFARSFGVTWEEIASALGVSRQAAWGRFANQARRQPSRRASQAYTARRAELLRELHGRIDGDDEEFLALQEWLGKRAKKRRQ